MSDVINLGGKEIDFEAAVYLMDNEIRERLAEIDWNSNQEFFSAYEKEHAKKYNEEWELSKANPVW